MINWLGLKRLINKPDWIFARGTSPPIVYMGIVYGLGASLVQKRVYTFYLRGLEFLSGLS